MTTSQPEVSFDALIPADMAKKGEATGVKKAALPFMKTFALAVLAGAFIGLGAMFCTVVLAGLGGTAADAAKGTLEISPVPYGIQRLLAGLVFCLGLVLVVVGGAELFTGNNLIVMAWASGKVTTTELLRNWGIVYLGNFVGSVLTALIVFLGMQYTMGGGAIGKVALNIAITKTNLGFVQAIALGMMCNALVCLAVWMCFGARGTVDKIAAIIFPISAFVAASFEHSVANMYFIPMGLFIKDFDPTFTAATKLNVANLNWGTFLLNNLLPVTIGNIIGGAVMVGIVYWFVYLRQPAPQPGPAAVPGAQAKKS
jgi:formate transporter